jgi:hypothetical protein
MLDPSVMSIEPPILPPAPSVPQIANQSSNFEFEFKDGSNVPTPSTADTSKELTDAEKKDKKREKKEKKKAKKEKHKAEKKQKELENLSAKEKEEFLRNLIEERPEYYDFKSEHCLMPLIPASNSYNRNFVLTMQHSGVKAIIDSIGKAIEEKYNVGKARE